VLAFLFITDNTDTPIARQQARLVSIQEEMLHDPEK
jgi:hypothetical protein